MRVYPSLGVLVLTLATAACGAAPGSNDPVAAPRPQPVATPSSGLGVPPDQGLVARSYAAFSAMRGYEAELGYYQKQGAKSSTGLYAIAGRSPRKLRIHIKQGTGEGAKLLWEGGRKLKVRAGGLLGAIALELPLDDARFVSVRNYTLDQTDIHSMYAMMRDPANAATPMGPDTVAFTGPKLLKGCKRMVVRFDPATALPNTVELNDAKEVVFRMRLKNFRPNDRVALDI
jgi:hypothetical protein